MADENIDINDISVHANQFEGIKIVDENFRDRLAGQFIKKPNQRAGGKVISKEEAARVEEVLFDILQICDQRGLARSEKLQKLEKIKGILGSTKEELKDRKNTLVLH